MGDAVTLVITCTGNQSQERWLKGVVPHHGSAERTLRSPNHSPRAKPICLHVLAGSTGGFSHLPLVFFSLSSTTRRFQLLALFPCFLASIFPRKLEEEGCCAGQMGTAWLKPGENESSERKWDVGHLSSVSGSHEQPWLCKAFAWCPRLYHVWSPEASLLSWSLWSRTGRVEGHGWVPLTRGCASLGGHGCSADTLNEAPAPGRDGGTLSADDAQACEQTGFLSRAESTRAWLEGGYRFLFRSLIWLVLSFLFVQVK